MMNMCRDGRVFIIIVGIHHHQLNKAREAAKPEPFWMGPSTHARAPRETDHIGTVYPFPVAVSRIHQKGYTLEWWTQKIPQFFGRNCSVRIRIDTLFFFNSLKHGCQNIPCLGTIFKLRTNQMASDKRGKCKIFFFFFLEKTPIISRPRNCWERAKKSFPFLLSLPKMKNKVPPWVTPTWKFKEGEMKQRETYLSTPVQNARKSKNRIEIEQYNSCFKTNKHWISKRKLLLLFLLLLSSCVVEFMQVWVNKNRSNQVLPLLPFRLNLNCKNKNSELFVRFERELF